jgi:antitoxin (DNA-binding transcriptional repressor) of toxin-antitoxin stability system
VKKGDDLLITERGRPVARIVREDPKNASLRVALRPLIEKGLITLPARMIDRQIPSPVQVSGKPISEMVIEDRR